MNPRAQALAVCVLIGIAAGSCAIGANGAAVPLVVEARLLEATAVPTPAEIAPYDSALVVHTYRILNVLSGELSDRDISVAHWAIQEKKYLDVPTTTNETVRLTLIPYHVCHELRGEKVVDTTGGFDLLYFFATEWLFPVERSP